MGFRFQAHTLSWLENNLLHRLLVSGGREGAVRVWDAAGGEGADVLAALGAGAGAQVSYFWSGLMT